MTSQTPCWRVASVFIPNPDDQQPKPKLVRISGSCAIRGRLRSE